MVIFSVFIFLSSFFYFLNEFVYSWILNIFTVEFCLCWWLSLLVWLVVPSQTSLPCFKCPFMTFKNLSHNVVSITHRHGRESNSVVKGTNYECRCISNYIVQYYHDWVWRAGVHTGFRTITLVLVLYISDLYQTWPHDSPVEEEEPYLFWGQ
jgi:hypothetical protein